MTRDFFERINDWSRWKHRILDKYLRIWFYKLGSAHRHLAFVDAFAGEGGYGSDPGSPVIAAKWNDDPLMQSRSGRLIVHACERKKKRAVRLREALAPWMNRQPPLAIVYEMRFHEALPTLLDCTRSMPTFFFIDPWGMKDITKADLLPLLQDQDRESTEVLVRADPTLFARYAGWLKEHAPTEEWRRKSKSFERLLQQLNVDTDSIREQRRRYGSISGKKMRLFDQYLSLFRERFRHVQLIPIRAAYFQSPKYLLIHGTNSPHGAAAINDAVSTTEDELFQHHVEERSGDQLQIFGRVERELTPEQFPRVSIWDAKEAIMRLLAESAPRSFINIRAELAMQYGPDLREKDHKRAVRELADERKINAVTNLDENTDIKPV